jgi:predicted RNA binding protein YcfA (HicA-like mRNA interferase family)
LVTLKTRQVLNGLEKKGFVRAEGDHTFLIFYVDGKKTSIHTKVSHGSNEIADYLINKMSIQIKLEKKKFLDLVTCPLSIEGYLEELKSQGYSFTE